MQKVTPLWRSKRFIASFMVGFVLAALVFILLRGEGERDLAYLSFFVTFFAVIVFLPRFVVRLHHWLLNFFSSITHRVIEDFLRERAKRAAKLRKKSRGKKKQSVRKIVLDTSAIIDGRFLKVVALGFLKADFIVPQCVLDELQDISDSKDTLRRLRGRRGLDILKRLKKIKGVKVKTADYKKEYGDLEVDRRLVKISKAIKADLMTVDFNLNKVSGVSGVKVLNINELVNGVKASVIPGEILSIKLVQEGKEEGQAVGYLEDGTMVVVENASKHIGKSKKVTVSRLLQTPAGQMIFASL